MIKDMKTKRKLIAIKQLRNEGSVPAETLFSIFQNFSFY